MVTNRPSRRRARPLPKGSSLYTLDATPARQSAERRSARPLMYLYQLPVWVFPVVVAVFLIAGLAMHGIAAAAALVVVALALGWLAAISWPRLSAAGRVARVCAVVIVLVAAAYRAVR